MIIAKLAAENAEPRRGDMFSNRPAIVVGQRRNNGGEWALVILTAVESLRWHRYAIAHLPMLHICASGGYHYPYFNKRFPAVYTA